MAPLTLSLPYAPPESVAALEANQHEIRASTAADVWALGVIAFELLTQSRLFPQFMPREEIIDKLAGRRPLPWEIPGWHRGKAAKGLLRLKASILQCLDRVALKRPCVSQVASAWNSLFAAETTTSISQT
jgi:serine/threonine protein kinase